MRVARVGFLRLGFAIGSAIALAAPGVAARAAPAATNGAAPSAQSFKVTISPEYTTAGQPTTFRVTVVNTSTPGTTLGLLKLTPPTGFTPPLANVDARESCARTLGRRGSTFTAPTWL